ncbi:hypothetical protein POTOM_003097 [Populus tomentosa]|uniref:Methyltransferase type 11 domain-containing protein n=1 Tax=Populus tomentosa TaxID=118781 RepID=A0A8X8DL31_POPTO|nr:hypothetical protein POTOM_003097 [Populus tomentosa]
MINPLVSQCRILNLAMSLAIKPHLHHHNHRMHKPTSTNSRDWTQIYRIYGMEQWQTLLFLTFQAILFSILSILFLLYFQPICQFLDTLFIFTPTPTPTSSTGGGSAARFAAGFTGCVTALSAVCLFFAAGNFFYSAVGLHYEMAQRIVSCVNDWSTVKVALDIGCGRGILLNAVATQLKKTGSSGRVVGLDRSKRTTLSTLRTANMEGVGEYVTCREGDVRSLPFGDNYFDVVVSATFVHTVGKEYGHRTVEAAAERMRVLGVGEYVTCREGDVRSLPFGDNYFDVVVSATFVHTVGKEYGHRTVEAAAERMRVLGEMVRVLKPCGVGVLWDLLHVPEYVRRLQELKMEDIRVSERVTAFMVSSHIVSFRKPSQHMLGPGEVRLDWRF